MHECQICPGMNANKMNVVFDRHLKVCLLMNVHQNTHNSVKYGVIRSQSWSTPSILNIRDECFKFSAKNPPQSKSILSHPCHLLVHFSVEI